MSDEDFLRFKIYGDVDMKLRTVKYSLEHYRQIGLLISKYVKICFNVKLMCLDRASSLRRALCNMSDVLRTIRILSFHIPHNQHAGDVIAVAGQPFVNKIVFQTQNVWLLKAKTV